MRAVREASPLALTDSPGRTRLLLHGGLVLCMAGVGGYWLGGVLLGRSLAFGIALSALNLLALQRVAAALAGAPGTSSAWTMVLPFKLIALAGVAFALVELGFAQPIPLAIGFALLPLTGILLPRASSVPRNDSPGFGRR